MQVLQQTPRAAFSSRTHTPSTMFDSSNNSGVAVSSPAATFESFPDRSNPTAARIIAMAQTLRIDPTSEFYLLPIALHALEAPEELVRIDHGNDSDSDGNGDGTDEVDGSDRYEKRRTDLEWFAELAQKERARFKRALAHTHGHGHATAENNNSPWVKIQEPAGGAAGEAAAAAYASAAASAPAASIAAAAPSSSSALALGRTYFYNFKTFRRAATMPPPSYSGNSGVGGGGGGGGFGGGEDDPSSSQLDLSPVSALSATAVSPLRAVAASGPSSSRGLTGVRRLVRPHHSELAVMRFTSWFIERGGHSSDGCDVAGWSASAAPTARGRTRFVKIRYFLDAEEFEVEIMPPSSGSASASSSSSSSATSTAMASSAAPTTPASFSTSGASAMAIAAHCREALASQAASKVYRVKSLRTKYGPASVSTHIHRTALQGEPARNPSTH